MQRRSALRLIAFGSMAPALAFAQGQRGTESRSGSAAQRYIQNTLDVGGLALATSLIAERKAVNPWVKRFANYETSEQEGIANVFRTLGGQPTSPAAEERLPEVQRLQALSGERFEEAYLRMQHDGHEQLLRVQNEFIQSGQDPMIRNMAMLIRNRVEEHLNLIAAIRGQIGAYARR